MQTGAALCVATACLAVTDSTLLLQAAAQEGLRPLALLQHHIFGRGSCTTFAKTSFTMGNFDKCQIAGMLMPCTCACLEPYLVDIAKCLINIMLVNSCGC